MDSLWGTINVARWKETPCLRGRIAIEQDVKDGRAVFYLKGDELAFYANIDLPRCAILLEGGQRIPVVIIQSELVGEKHCLGYRPLSGGNGVCIISEVQLLDEPDDSFYSCT